MHFGIPGYSPIFYKSSSEIIKDYKMDLLNLINQPIEKTLIMWDVNDDEWYQDGPVLISFGKTVLEVCVNKLDELAISFSTIDLSKKIEVMDLGECGVFQYEWKENALPQFKQAINKQVRYFELIEYNFKTGIEIIEALNKDIKLESYWILNGIGLGLDNGYLGIFNALDQNGITNDPYFEEDIRKILIAN